MEHETHGLELTPEEAYQLLFLALMSPAKLNAESEGALEKLAEFVKVHSNDDWPIQQNELIEAG